MCQSFLTGNGKPLGIFEDCGINQSMSMQMNLAVVSGMQSC